MDWKNLDGLKNEAFKGLKITDEAAVGETIMTCPACEAKEAASVFMGERY